MNTYYVFLDLEERFLLLLLLNTPESIWWSGCYYGDVQTDLKSVDLFSKHGAYLLSCVQLKEMSLYVNSLSSFLFIMRK